VLSLLVASNFCRWHLNWRGRVLLASRSNAKFCYTSREAASSKLVHQMAHLGQTMRPPATAFADHPIRQIRDRAPGTLVVDRKQQSTSRHLASCVAIYREIYREIYRPKPPAQRKLVALRVGGSNPLSHPFERLYSSWCPKREGQELVRRAVARHSIASVNSQRRTGSLPSHFVY
jgi:hypothetical protein